jgi:hypothetical protein
MTGAVRCELVILPDDPMLTPVAEQTPTRTIGTFPSKVQAIKRMHRYLSYWRHGEDRGTEHRTALRCNPMVYRLSRRSSRVFVGFLCVRRILERDARNPAARADEDWHDEKEKKPDA